jgi:hypothetical protein
LTGGAPAKARQAAAGGAQVALSATEENPFDTKDRKNRPIRHHRFGGLAGGAKRSAAGMG